MDRKLAERNLTAGLLATGLALLCFWIGIYPKPFLDFLHRPVGDLAALVKPGLFGPGAAQAPAPVPVTAVGEEAVVPEGREPGH